MIALLLRRLALPSDLIDSLRLALGPAGRLLFGAGRDGMPPGGSPEPADEAALDLGGYAVAAADAAGSGPADPDAEADGDGPSPPESGAALGAGATEALARFDWADRLWGPGFALPGGEPEILRLAGLLPLSSATTLLLVGGDAGGGAAAIARERKCWVALHAADPHLLTRMVPRLKRVGRRVEAHAWDPAAPDFRPFYHHHAMLLEVLRSNPDPLVLLQAIAAGLKAGGQLVLVETVAEPPPPEQTASLQRWMSLEGRTAPPPSRPAMEALLRTAGFRVHVTEDAGERYDTATTAGWAQLVGAMRGGLRSLDRVVANALVNEAERWALRHRLREAGVLGTFRWHASLRL